eukprot:4549292-Alexandrium_andersonii.AAC.1
MQTAELLARASAAQNVTFRTRRCVAGGVVGISEHAAGSNGSAAAAKLPRSTSDQALLLPW